MGRVSGIVRGVGGAFLAFAATLSSAMAMENGQSSYVKGYRDFMSGVLPAPGVQIRADSHYYSGRERSTIPQGQLGIKLTTLTNVLSATVVTPYQWLGGNYAYAVRVGATNVSAEQSVGTRLGTTTRSGSMFGLNDMVVTPVIFGWHAGPLHWNVSASVWVPVGSYDKNRVGNTGRNYRAGAPQIGVTYYDPKVGWEFSGAGMILFSSTNTATNYRSGDIIHLDFAVGKDLSPQLRLGAVGYLAQQITADSGAGAILGDRKMSVTGLGPAVAFTFPVNNVPVALVAKYYREFNAQNTTQGDAGSLSMRVKF